MLTFRGMSVTIRVDGKDLPCFHPEYDEETKTATCWIPSEAGKAYGVWVKQRDIKQDTTCRVYIDGSKTSAVGLIFSHGIAHILDAANWSVTEDRPFMFGDVEVTDDDKFLKNAVSWKSPGTIQLTVHRVRKVGQPMPLRTVDVGINTQNKPLHEKNKKALNHVTQLGPVRTRVKQTVRDTEPYTPSDTAPWVTFVFRYRPAAILQAEELMPRPEGAKPSDDADADGSELTQEVDEAAQKAEILAIEEEERRIEAERVALDVRKAALTGGLRVKKEETARRKPGRMQKEEVIDLTLSP